MARSKASAAPSEDREAKERDRKLKALGFGNTRTSRLPIQKWGAGVVIMGTFENMKKLPDNKDKKGGHIFYFTDEDGQRQCYGAPAILAEALEGFEQGDFFRVECIGKVPSNKGNDAWNFDVRVKENA